MELARKHGHQPARNSGTPISLTVYDPEHDTSEDDTEHENEDHLDNDQDLLLGPVAPKTPIRNSPTKTQIREIKPASDNATLSWRDIELLFLVCTAADKTNPRESNELNYANLYMSLDAFYKSNNLVPSNYLAYNLCIYATMLLCSYDLPTWRQRLDAFIDDCAARAVAGNTQVQLEKSLHNLETKLTRRFLTFWNAKTTYLKLVSHDMTQVAEQRDARSLKRETLETWKYRKEVADMQIRHVDTISVRNLLGRFILRLKTQKDKSIGLKSTLSTYILRKHLTKMTTRYNTVVSNTEEASRMFLLNTAKNQFLAWFYATYEKRAVENYEHRLRQEMILQWLDKYDTVFENKQISLQLEYTHSVGKVANYWLARLNDHEANERLADRILKKRVLRRYTDRWIFFTDMKVKHNIVNYMYNKNAVRGVFRNWKQLTLQRMEADRFRRFILLKRATEVWKLESTQKIMRSNADAGLLAHKFHHWLLSERLVLFQRYKDEAHLNSYLNHWIYSTAKIFKKAAKNMEKAKEYDNHALLEKYMMALLNKTKVHAQNDVKSIELRIGFLTGGIVQYMAAKTKQTQEQLERAEELDKKLLLIKGLVTWKKRMNKSVSERLSLSMLEFQEMQKVRSERTFFTVWRNLYLLAKENGKIADLSQELSQQKTMRQLLGIWRDRLAVEIDRNDSAAMLYEEELLSGALNNWKQKLAGIEEMEDEGKFLAEVRDLQIQEHLYRRWRTHAFRFISQQRNADDFYQRLQNMRFHKTWKHWVARTQDKQYMTMAMEDQVTVRTPTGSPIQRSERSGPGDVSSLLETPSRVRFRTFVPATTVERWRRTKEGLRESTPMGKRRLFALSTPRVRNIAIPATMPVGDRR